MGGPQAPAAAERILIVDEEWPSCAETSTSITEQIPSAVVAAVDSLAAFRSIIAEQQFDVVILDGKLSDTNPIELLHEIRLAEFEPAVLVVSSSSDPALIAEMYNHGCQRCLVKEGEWRPQLGATIRHALRYRKLRERNRDLNSRLVEANVLLAEKNKRLDEFCAVVAHDIRGPLAALSMKLDFILGDDRFGIDPRAREMLGSGAGSVERLIRIVQSMYEYAKLGTAGSLANVVELGPLVEEVLEDMPFAEDARISVGLGSLPRIWGNKELLRRLFMNLITNAVKYNDSPDVRLNIGIVDGLSERPGEIVDVYVEDNGRGIAPDELGRVFGMFQRGSSAGSDAEGLGIGLAVVQRIAELHGGRVRVVSEVGQGSRFTVSLPLYQSSLS